MSQPTEQFDSIIKGKPHAIGLVSKCCSNCARFTYVSQEIYNSTYYTFVNITVFCPECYSGLYIIPNVKVDTL